MFSDDGYAGCAHGFEGLRTLNDRLNAKVVEKINDTQELVMINNFAHETNEYQYKKCLEDRISNISSWRWVLEDLSKRLGELMSSLLYEHNALRVVLKRIDDEIAFHSQESSKPGALCPLTDSVEEAILNELKFLRDEKKKFENIKQELEHEMAALDKTKKRIDTDVKHKLKTISLEESCANIDKKCPGAPANKKKKKKRQSPIPRWENRCTSLKQAGLKALSNAIVTRHQIRGARVHLSITAQAYAGRVDSALRRRLHANTIKLQELNWQKDEALRDLKSLDEELETTEQNLIETMDQERIVGSRLADRMLRPQGELTRDDVDKKLRDELARLRNFSKQLRKNIESIICLQNNLNDAVARINCCAEDLTGVIRLDEDRVKLRNGEEPKAVGKTSNAQVPVASTPPATPQSSPRTSAERRLSSIQEVDEDEDDDDYPFKDSDIM